MSNGQLPRHPLGLPPGSVRGVLSLLIVIQFWILLGLPDDRRVPVPINLYLLMTLVAIFFVSHGKTIGGAAERTPLYLPGGTLRILILGGTAAIIGYLYVNHPERLWERLRPAEAQFTYWPSVVAAYAGGFAVGYLFRLMPFRQNWAFQSFLAWMSILAMVLLFVEIFIQAFIRKSLKEDIDLRVWEAIVTAVCTCYFATRS